MDVRFSLVIFVLGVCVGEVKGAPDNAGTEFIIGFMENHYTRFDVELFVTTSKTTTVSVTITSPKYSNPKISKSFTVTSGKVEQVFISNNLRASGSGKSSKGLRISASDEVVVYGINKETYSTDGFLALPVDILGTEYFAVVHYPSMFDCEFMVVATQDGTSVTVTLPNHSSISMSFDGRSYSRNSVISVSMNSYDMAQFKDNAELTGAKIVSNKPIAFFSGNLRTNIGRGSSSDHIDEQMIPVKTWGKKFATVPIPTRTTGDYFRFVASESGTTVTVAGRVGGSSFSDSFTLSQPGSFVEKLYSSQLYALVTASKPIQIVQLVLSQVTEEADPAMLLVAPIEQYAADYTFSTPKYSQGSYRNYFMFIVSNSQRSGLRMDGNPLSSSTTYNAIPGTDLVAGYVMVNEGSHTVRHTSPISVFCGYLFGLAKWESYAFPTGMRLAPVNAPCHPTSTVTGDGIDNDCDGLIDEELCISGSTDDDGDGRHNEDCAKPPPVDGQWSNWGSYTACSKTCSTGGTQYGTYSRTRTCTNPAPAYDGKQCSGSSSQSSSCSVTNRCPVHGGWSNWSSWSGCSVTCASGTQTRTRACNNPTAQYGGNACSGSTSNTKTCTKSACPINGNWASWGNWNSCTKSCGGGTRSRSRTCTNPAPQHNGNYCSGSSSSSTSCNTHSCAVHGAWASWGSWGSCTVTCGGGQQTRSRTCTNPAPAHGGRNCPNSATSTQSCNTHHCPIDGSWTGWGSWSSCTATCGGGVQSKTRSCSNPTPQYGGAQCPGYSSSSQRCNTHNCPIHGGWANWGSWRTCSLTCGGGTQSRSRTCTNPTPQYNGNNCPSSSTSSQSCNTQHCPIDGGFTSWSGWGSCTVTCGGGIKTRTRTCTNPSPQYGGARCSGATSSDTSCNTQVCIIDGAWGAWQAWGTCSVSCGGGKQSRARVCNDPRPANGGLDCPGSSSELTDCNSAACPTPAAGAYVQLCPTGWFTCESGGITCIDRAFMCDCASDCDDGSDETVQYAGCSAKMLADCPSGAGTVLVSWLCVMLSVFIAIYIH